MSISFAIRADTSLYFSTNMLVEKAILTVGGVILSIIQPGIGIHESVESACQPGAIDQVDQTIKTYDLKFFGDKPFHAALPPGEQRITLYCSTGVPTLTTRPADTTITWANLTGDTYVEQVTAGSDTGLRKLLLVYSRNYCAYRREQPVSTDDVVDQCSTPII